MTDLWRIYSFIYTFGLHTYCIIYEWEAHLKTWRIVDRF